MVRSGFTLIELMMVIAMVGVLAAIAFPSYTEMVEKGRVAEAKSDISAMMQTIERYYVGNNDYPNSLADIGANSDLDPWEKPYVYFKILGNRGANRRQRRDQGLQPLNTDFDLFSLGKDKNTTRNISQSTGRDDVVRARNGRYIGLGKDF